MWTNVGYVVRRQAKIVCFVAWISYATVASMSARFVRRM